MTELEAVSLATSFKLDQSQRGFRDLTFNDAFSTPALQSSRSFKWSPPMTALLIRQYLKPCNNPTLDAVVPGGVREGFQIENPEKLPDASFHMFCHRRVKNVQDDQPKYATFLNSQWRFPWAVIDRSFAGEVIVFMPSLPSATRGKFVSFERDAVS